MQNSQTFWSALEQRIAPFDLLQHPFYKAWTMGELTSADLREYASEYWHHVSAFPTYLSALHARLPDGQLRRTVLENLADEEGMYSAERRAHSDLWMDFAEGFGATRANVESRTLQPETAEVINTFRSLMQSSQPAAAFAALYAYESRVPAIAKEKYSGLMEKYNADAKSARYFKLHETADVHHSNVWKQLMDQELAANPEATEEALVAAETAAKALWQTLDGIERQRTAALAN